MGKNSDQGWVARALASGALRALGFYIVQYVLPFGVSALTFLTGYMNGQPWMWIIMASSLALFGVSGSILWLDQLRDRRRVAEKLLFIGPFIGIDKTSDGKAIQNIQIGFVLKNTASFPISYTVKKITTTADGTVPGKGQMNSWGALIQPGMETTFRHTVIVLKQPATNFDATLEFELTYGRQGSEKYDMQRSIDMTVRYNPLDSNLNYPWLDATKAT